MLWDFMFVPVTACEPRQGHFLLLRRFWILNVWLTLPGRSLGMSSRNQNLGPEKGHGGGYPVEPPFSSKSSYVTFLVSQLGPQVTTTTKTVTFLKLRGKSTDTTVS